MLFTPYHLPKLLRIRRVLFQGGVDPEIPIEYFEEVFREIRRETRGEVAVHGLTAVEIDWYSRIHRVSVRELVERLVEAGLDSVSGGVQRYLWTECARRYLRRRRELRARLRS